MLFTEKLEEEYRDGYEAGENYGEKNARISIIQNALSEKGPLKPELEEYLETSSIPTLDTWVRLAFEAENCEMFLQKIGK